jgi:uncharacterized protein (DUF305 family)
MGRKAKVAAIVLGLMSLSAGAWSDDAARAFDDVMKKMHEAMMMDYAGDPDVHFIRSMIPHHQGAIDMAEVELRYGKDPEARALAERIIEAQKAEIAEMNGWLKARGQ